MSARLTPEQGSDPPPSVVGGYRHSRLSREVTPDPTPESIPQYLKDAGNRTALTPQTPTYKSADWAEKITIKMEGKWYPVPWEVFMDRFVSGEDMTPAQQRRAGNALQLNCDFAKEADMYPVLVSPRSTESTSLFCVRDSPCHIVRWNEHRPVDSKIQDSFHGRCRLSRR